jgi:excisionase family DNA binding protein
MDACNTIADAIPADLISTRVAAKLLGGCNIATVYRWVMSGRLQGWRRGQRWFVRRADVLAVWQRAEVPAAGVDAGMDAGMDATRPRRTTRVRTTAWEQAESARRGMD